MPATVVVGAQLGDEGKGKIVDFLADRADVVVRFQGGANAGHTVQVGEQLYAFHLLPSGVLRKRAMNVIGNGVVIDPAQLLKEIDETRAHGHSVQNLRISDRAHVVMPYHKVIDGLEEKLKGNLGAGTTLRGIGPSFEDKVGRFGIRMCDLVDPIALREKLETIVPIKQRLIEAFGGTERLDLESIYKEQVEYGTTTRRPRRVGWLDLVMLRMAVRVNGLVSLAVTKLDVLGGLDRIPVCVGYRVDGETIKEFPASMRTLSRCEPIYREFKGWPDLSGPAWIATARKGRRALPETVRKYLGFIEAQLKVPVRIISVGRPRAATIGR